MKLASLSTSRETVEAFGVPGRLAIIAGVALPLAEIAVAAALLPSLSARWGAAGALALLCVISAGVMRALHQGRAPACNCFGQVSSAPISSQTLLRNGALSAVAVFVLLEAPGSALTSWTSNGAAANLVAALGVTATTVLGVIAWARRGAGPVRAPERPTVMGSPALPLGTPAPGFELPDLHGEIISLRQLLARGQPVVLIFASPHCGPCVEMVSQFSRWNGAIGDDITLVVIESDVESAGHLPEEQRALLDGLVCLTEPARDLATRYGAAGTPCAVSITAEGRLSSQPMIGTEFVERLIRRVLASSGASLSAEAALADGAVDALRHRRTTTPRQRLSGEAFGVGVSLEAEQSDVLLRMADCLPPAWHPGQPGAQPINFEVRSEAGGTYELLQDEYQVDHGTLDDVLESFEMRLRSHVAWAAPEHVFVHAGAVAFDGRAIIVPGESFSGKTTMVAALVKAGAIYYSDDYAVFDSSGLVHPYPKPLATRDGGPEYRGKRHSLPGRRGAPTDDQPVRLGLALCTQYRRGAEWAPARLTPAQALLELIPHTFRSPSHAAQTLRTLGAAFDASVVGLKGDRGDAAELVPQVWQYSALELTPDADGRMLSVSARAADNLAGHPRRDGPPSPASAHPAGDPT